MSAEKWMLFMSGVSLGASLSLIFTEVASRLSRSRK